MPVSPFALNDVKPALLRDFYRLAAVQVRRELIDLARHYYGPQGHGAHHASAVQRTKRDYSGGISVRGARSGDINAKMR